MSVFSAKRCGLLLIRHFSAIQVNAPSEAILSALKTSLKTEMKLKNKTKVNVIKSMLAEILNAEKSGLYNNGKQIPVAQLLQTSIKKRKDSIAAFRAADRNDLADAEESEIKILEEYLPTQMSRDEISQVVSEAIVKVQATTSKDKGKVMKEVCSKIDDSVASKKLVAEVVADLLSKIPK